jgi:intergrase/recombinase
LGKKTKKLFHGVIRSQNEEELCCYTVKFAREKESSFLIFPEKDYISEVDASQIVKVLPHPEINPKGLYYFL